MSTILDTIAAYAKVRVEQDKEALPLEQLKEMVKLPFPKELLPKNFPM